LGWPALKPSSPFFPAELASQLLLKLEQVFTKSEAIPDSTDMPASPALNRTFDAAMALSKQLGHKQVEPLHLLAAALSEPSSKASEVLKEAGVTREGVIAAMRAAEPDDDA
jgi:ATP-dependent Clp protease ATP-binding subunit ClpA